MGRKVVTVTHPDGTKKVIVGQPNSSQPVKTREPEEDRRPKPGTPKISISKERNGYKHGGKFKFKTC
jgi:hypothetical protein